MDEETIAKKRVMHKNEDVIRCYDEIKQNDPNIRVFDGCKRVGEKLGMSPKIVYYHIHKKVNVTKPAPSINHVDVDIEQKEYDGSRYYFYKGTIDRIMIDMKEFPKTFKELSVEDRMKLVGALITCQRKIADTLQKLSKEVV